MEPESRQTANFFFSSFFFFFSFRWPSSIVCDSFTLVFTQNRSILHIAFSQICSLRRWFYYGFICNAIFFTCMHVHKSLSNETYSSLKFAELEYSCVHEDRESLCHPWLTWCLNRAWPMILLPILHTTTEEACEDRLVFP